MRALKTAPILALATLALAGSSSAAAHHHHKPCTIPHGWKLAAADRYAVVIRQRHTQQPTYEYCNRMVGKWRIMMTMEDPGSIDELRITGRFVAYESSTAGWPLWLWDTRTGQANLASGFKQASASLLSPAGVAVRFVTITQQSPTSSYETVVQALTPSAFYNLDYGYNAGLDAFAHLQLFDCTAGCAPNAVIVAWTHSGEQRYGEVAAR
jgi:hypothetical protein